jgi:16S rRNA processing protein RimM
LQSKDYLKIAKILRPHGIKGELRLYLYSEDIQQYQHFYLDNLVVKISFRGFKANNAIAKIENIETINQAIKLQNSFIFIKKSQLAPLSSGDLYYADLIDSKVRAIDGSIIGVVTNVANYGAGDVITICFNNHKSEEFPFTKEIFPQFDSKQQELTFRKPEIV